MWRQIILCFSLFRIGWTKRSEGGEKGEESFLHLNCLGDRQLIQWRGGRTSRKQTWLILLPDGFSHHSDIAENWKRRNLSWKWYSWYFQGGWPSVGAAGPGPDFLRGLDHSEPIPAPDKNKENLEKDFSSIRTFEAISNLRREKPLWTWTLVFVNTEWKELWSKWEVLRNSLEVIYYN